MLRIHMYAIMVIQINANKHVYVIMVTQIKANKHVYAIMVIQIKANISRVCNYGYVNKC